MPCIIYIQELSKSGSSSSDHKILQQSSEIEMLNTKLKILRKQYTHLIDVHSKCKSQKEISKSISIQTDDQV